MLTLTSTSALLDEQRERLVAGFSRKMRNDPYLEVFQKIARTELEQLIRTILIRLSAYINGDDGEVQRSYDAVGNACFQLSIPLLEAAYALFLLRDKIVALLVAGQSEDNVDECTRAARFFDTLVLEMLRRY